MKRKIRDTFWRVLYVALSVALIYANSVGNVPLVIYLLIQGTPGSGQITHKKHNYWRRLLSSAPINIEVAP